MIAGLVFLFLAVAYAQHPTYIVIFNDEMPLQELHAHVNGMHTTGLLGAEQVSHIYTNALKGYAAQMSPQALLQAKAHPQFKFFEEDQRVFALKTVKSQEDVDTKATCTQYTAESWGLTRISQRDSKLDNLYAAPQDGGKGVTAYIVDTGIYVDHEDFQGRAKFGFKANTAWSDTDGNGHGTHVASTVGGLQWGVAKHVNLVAVKVLSDSGSGTNAGVIAGVDWATAEHKKNGGNSVANLSLGGGYSAALNAACTAAMKAGLFMVVAAGNEDSDACDGSPSSASDVVCVGATETGAGNTPDVRSYFSNYGVCVDIFAPGTDITAAWIGGPSKTRTISGTSMASPHVCGIAALIKGTDPKLPWDDVKSILIDSSTKGRITLNCGSGSGRCNESPNLLAYNGCSH